MTTAVIGGGLTGCLVALDLAERGRPVVIFEKESDLIQRASLVNEGKIHLGYVYAADHSFLTARTLIDDAMVFRPLLERWMPTAVFEEVLTAPFHYIIPDSSTLPRDKILQHFQQVEDYLSEQEKRHHRTYLGNAFDKSWPAPAARFNAQSGMVETHERAVWPAGIANAMRDCVSIHPLITLHVQTCIDSIVPTNGKWRVKSAASGHQTEGPFDTIVNASWAGRRIIDRNSGFASSEKWFTRYKFGVLLENASDHFDGALPRNGTGTSGSYGDSVYYPQNDSLYCSWYPVGMCFTSRNDRTDFSLEVDTHREQLMRDTWAGYAGIDPDFRQLGALQSPLQGRLNGDFIVAKGQTDIDDAASLLHERSSHGPQELAPGYWTIDTGKYTSAPRCAAHCVAAIAKAA